MAPRELALAPDVDEYPCMPIAVRGVLEEPQKVVLSTHPGSRLRPLAAFTLLWDAFRSHLKRGNCTAGAMNSHLQLARGARDDTEQNQP